MPEKPDAPKPPPPRDGQADYSGPRPGEQPGQTQPRPRDIPVPLPELKK